MLSRTSDTTVARLAQQLQARLQVADGLHPPEMPWAFGVSFFVFLCRPPPFQKSMRDLRPPLKPRAAGCRPWAQGLVPRPAALARRPQPDEGSRRVGTASSFIVLVFSFGHSTHIKESVFKTQTNPEMCIWDHDKATKRMKPQVSCFKWTTPPLGVENRSGDSVYRAVYSVMFTETLWHA